MAAAAIGRSRRLPELFDSTSDEDSGSKRKKRRRSSRRKAAEARSKIQESARRDQSSDDSDDELQPGAGSPSRRKKRPLEAPRSPVPVENPSHELIKLQQLLDHLENPKDNFSGVRWALTTLVQVTSATGPMKTDFKIAQCPDLLLPLIDLVGQWLRRPKTQLTHVDETQHAEMARRTVAATQTIRNLSYKSHNTDTLVKCPYLIATLAALANDLPKAEDGTHEQYLHTRDTRDDKPRTFVYTKPAAAATAARGRKPGHEAGAIGAHPILENIMATWANISPSLLLHEEGGAHTCLPVIVRGLAAEHKLICSSAASCAAHSLPAPRSSLPPAQSAACVAARWTVSRCRRRTCGCS